MTTILRSERFTSGNVDFGVHATDGVSRPIYLTVSSFNPPSPSLSVEMHITPADARALAAALIACADAAEPPVPPQEAAAEVQPDLEKVAA